MPVPSSESDSTVTSTNLFDLDLPVVREGEGPLPLGEPSYELMREHAWFLLRAGGLNAAPSRPNPEPFVLE